MNFNLYIKMNNKTSKKRLSQHNSLRSNSSIKNSKKMTNQLSERKTLK